MALKIDILANTRQTVSEMKKAGASIEDLSDSLDAVARDGEHAAEEMERSFKDLARQASATGKKVGKDLDDGFDKASKGADEFKDESRSTAREAAASFDGSAESIGDAFQEVAANAFAGFGPAGEAAGLAIALGIGAAITAITNASEVAEELRQNITDMYREAADEGRVFLSEAQIQAEATRLIFEDRNRLQEEGNRLGVDAITLARAYAGDQEAVQAAIELGNEKLTVRRQRMEESRQVAGTVVKTVDLEAAAIENVINNLNKTVEIHKQQQSNAQAVADLRKRSAAEERADIAANRAADQARYENYARNWSTPRKAQVDVKVNVDNYQLNELDRRIARGAQMLINPRLGPVWQ